MTAKRLLPVCLGWIIILSLAGSVFTSVKADGGGFPTATRTVTPTRTTPPTQAATATFTSLPTLTPVNVSNQSQPEQVIPATPEPVTAQTSTGFTPGCWPIAILILLALILLGTYYVSRRLRGESGEQ